MSYIITSLMALLLGLSAVLWLRLKAEQRENERATKAKKALAEKVKQQAVEIQQKNAEVKNAHIVQQAHQTVRRSSNREVDRRLHESGWFRAEDNGDGLSGIRADLRQSSGHDRDETSDSGSQSDTSGDLSR